VALRAELNELRLEVQQQRDAGAALRQAVDSGEAARRQLIDAQAAERTRWAEERTLLQERARENEEQAAALARKIRSVVEAQRDQAGQHALEKSRLEAEANEATQQLTELRAVHASLLATISQRLEAFERERAEWKAERHRATSELDAAEGWSSDQQDLLYRIRQQMATVFSLLDGSPHLLGPRPVTRELPAGTAIAAPAPIEADALPSEPAAIAS
jgi:chromosome segregation ATPase